MRKILFLFLAVRVFTVNAQLLPENVEEEDLQGTYTERIDEVLENLDKTEITSGYLMDRGIVEYLLKFSLLFFAFNQFCI